MDTILKEVESYQWSQGRFGQLQPNISIYPLANALARASTLLSQDMDIRAVNVLTHSGRTARLMSAARPNAPIVAYSCNPQVVNQMLLYWGVVPVQVNEIMSSERFAEVACATVKQMGIGSGGDYILLVSNFSPQGSGRESPEIIVYPVVG
jgi:pyruvate kinase